jgi:hypothetical protein
MFREIFNKAKCNNGYTCSHYCRYTMTDLKYKESMAEKKT